MSPSTKVRKRRELPISGTILVQEGQQVTSEQVIGEAKRDGELRLVRVAEVLNLSPGEALKRLCVAEGDVIEEGETLAEMTGLWGLFRTTVEAPIHGTVEFISSATGHVGLRGAASTIQLKAYINGTVSLVEPSSGVVIESEASFVQGIFGVGGERTGVVHILSVGCGDRLDEAAIPDKCTGLILVGGHSPTLAALQKASSLGAVGLITGSIDDRTLKDYVGLDIGIALTGDEDITMTLIITEGFGAIPINQKVIEILGASHGERGSINGATQVRAGAVRPEIITGAQPQVHNPSGQVESQGLCIGSNVRLIRVPFFGAYGVVVDLPRDLTRIETGAMARVAKVRLTANSQEVTVPRANLELA
jgi:hypothetical protein